jgi:hypothetical protein
MKRSLWILVLVVCLIAIPTVTSASMNQFTGRWVNVDSGTSGLTLLQISHSASGVSISAWGQCSPSDCPWGTASATVFGPNVSADPSDSALALSAVFTTSFNQSMLIVRPSASGGGPARIQVDVYTHFTDGSNRSPYTATHIMQRQLPTPIPFVLTAPVQMNPSNGSTFDLYPRTMIFDWQSVNGAASYTLEVDYFLPFPIAKWISEKGTPYQIFPNITTTQYTSNFVGKGTGRWRVWAVSSNGTEGPKSPWWDFKHLK